MVTSMFDLTWGWIAFVVLTLSNRFAISGISDELKKKRANAIFASLLLALIVARIVEATMT